MVPGASLLALVTPRSEGGGVRPAVGWLPGPATLCSALSPSGGKPAGDRGLRSCRQPAGPGGCCGAARGASTARPSAGRLRRCVWSCSWGGGSGPLRPQLAHSGGARSVTGLGVPPAPSCIACWGPPPSSSTPLSSSEL